MYPNTDRKARKGGTMLVHEVRAEAPPRLLMLREGDLVGDKLDAL